MIELSEPAFLELKAKLNANLAITESSEAALTINGIRFTNANYRPKLCIKCNSVKPLVHFGKNKGRNDGRQAYCKFCAVDYIRDYRQKYPVKLDKPDNRLRNHLGRYCEQVDE